MADGSDVDGVGAGEVEEQTVVAAAKTEAGSRRFEFLHIAVAVEQIAVQTVENLQRGFAVDRPNVGSGRR